MKKYLRILRITLRILVLAAFGTLLGFVEATQYEKTCRTVKIRIDYGSADTLVSVRDIDSLMIRAGGRIKGRALGTINLSILEKAIAKQPYVEKAALWTDHEGTLFADISQRQPILRIINKEGESSYLDESGALLPVNPDYSVRVLVATGNIDDSYAKKPGYRVNILSPSDSVYYDSLVTNLYRLTYYISRDPFFKSHIEQIYVNDAREFELIPRVGAHVILMGTTEDLDQKFRKLFAFYKFGLNKIGWNKYNVINLKYKNQVVCSKM